MRKFKIKIACFTRFADTVEEIETIISNLNSAFGLKGETVNIYTSVNGALKLVRTATIH